MYQIFINKLIILISIGFQVLEAGLATHFVSSEQLPGLEKEIIGLEEKAGNIVQLERLLSAFQVSTLSTFLFTMGAKCVIKSYMLESDVSIERLVKSFNENSQFLSS